MSAATLRPLLFGFVFWGGFATIRSADESAGGGTIVHGRVLDPTGAPIPGATITVSSGPVERASLVSDRKGEFSVALESGDYTFSIAAEGFRKLAQSVRVSRGGTEVREFVLPVAEVHETIVVTESGGYQFPALSSATRTLTPLRDIPQAITVVTGDLMRDQMMRSIGEVVRYAPGVTAHQGENNRDQVIIRGNNSSADFFVNGLRDDVQYYRDLYNLERVEVLKGPNAMAFGRGGGGGVINRVTKEPGFFPFREVRLLGGSYRSKRFTVDLDQPLRGSLAARLNAMYENDGSFRKYVGLERHGINPALAIAPDERTKITLAYEHFRDDRVADRGIPSFGARPLNVDPATYFGNPRESHAGARVNLGWASVERQAGRLVIRNKTLAGDYDRGYQNFVPGAVTADATQVAISAYNNATRRRNFFNQTDAVYPAWTGGVRHTFLAGAEAGRQSTDNFRNTGYFGGTAAFLLAPVENPAGQWPTTFRQSPTDADNHVRVTVAAVYIQDQIEFSRFVQGMVGLRWDRFDLHYHNRRNGESLRRPDNLVSPRAGLVFKPAVALSIYGSYSVSHLPSSGDQFSSLTAITQQVKPEKFNNYEVGAKWDIRPELSLTTAVYRLDRTNTRSIDPNDPTRIIQTGSQRSNGWEVGVNGSVTRAWQIAGGYAWQDAFISRATASARAGARVPQAPRHSFSVWNRYRIAPRLAGGLGLLHRTDVFAAIDNTVILPGYTRADAAVFYSVTERVELQANVENLTGKRYYINADNNTNISPGSPRAIWVAVTARF